MLLRRSLIPRRFVALLRRSLIPRRFVALLRRSLIPRRFVALRRRVRPLADHRRRDPQRLLLPAEAVAAAIAAAVTVGRAVEPGTIVHLRTLPGFLPRSGRRSDRIVSRRTEPVPS